MPRYQVAAVAVVSFFVFTGASSPVSRPGSALSKRRVEAPASPGPASTAWTAQLQRTVEEAEYEISWQAAPAAKEIPPSWHAPNRAQGFRTYFLPEGIRVVPRAAEAKSWRWGLRLVGYGRGDETGEVPTATLSPSGHRIEYRRGGLQELYLNTAEGLEQRFVLQTPPAKASNASAHKEDADASAQQDELHLDLALWGSLLPKIAEDGQAIDFLTGSGAAVIHYAGLKVTDARGRILPARMEGFSRPEASGIRIALHARDAVYPITVDPLATSPAWSAFGGQANARFGTVVATAGDVNGDGYSDVLVGAPLYDNGQADEGRGCLYLGTPAGLAGTPAWIAEGNQNNNQFALSIATAGDVNGDGFSDVIVGAHQYSSASVVAAGRASVYLGSPTGLPVSPNWTVEGTQTFSFLGYAVSTAGDVNNDGYSDVIVGAHGTAAYVYLGSSSGLAATPASTVLTDAPAGFIDFGDKVATAEDVNGDGYADVLVSDDVYSNGESNEGKVYLYLGSPGGIVTTPAWTAEGNQPSAHLGAGLGTAGDVNGDGYSDVITGAYGASNAGVQSGRASLYLGSPSGLPGTPSWTATGAQAGELLGNSVGAAGDIDGDGYADVVVGASGYANGQTAEGRALLFRGSAGGLGATPAWTVESNSPNALFGFSAATAGDVNGDGLADVVVGAPYYDGAFGDQGAAFLYLGGSASVPAAPAWSIQDDQPEGYVGASVASAGDVNGDGYADVIVGAPGYDTGQTDEGRALVYLGGASGLATTPSWIVDGDQDGITLGSAVASAGDVNRDGYSDVIVGAAGNKPWFDPTGVAGRAFVYLGSATGLAAFPVWTAISDQTDALFGGAVASAGDVNGDGYADVLVGADRYSNGENLEGRAFLYLGSPLGPGAGPAWTTEGNLAGAHYGHSLASAGDINGDGYSDVIVGAYGYNNGQTFTGGRVSLYLGSSNGLATTPIWTEGSLGANVWYGASVGSAGDVNGDGYADVLVGAPFTNGASGTAYLYYGSASGIAGLGWLLEANFNETFGYPVGPAGDVNGDGYADVLVCASETLSYLFLGSASGLGTVWSWLGPDCWSLASAGDVNGDGFADIVGGTLYGATRVWYGGGGGVDLHPRQRQSDGSGPIAPGGRSNAAGAFTLEAKGRTPFGRSRVRLEWEIRPLGSSFTGTSVLTTDDPFDTGTSGVNLAGTAAGLNPGSYHWRVRLRYDTARTPYAQKSRWFTMPWHGWQEAHLTLGAFLGGWVWNDLDGDGVREGGEPGRAGATVELLTFSGFPLTATTTDGDGRYDFHLPGVGASFRLRFSNPVGMSFTLRDQGSDLLDSDPDPANGETGPAGPGFTFVDSLSWSAGLVCNTPPLPVTILVRREGGTSNVILDVTDPNPAGQVSGYNVYRSNQAQPPPAPWNLSGFNIVDEDPGTPGTQWTDTSGDTPPTGTAFYYQVTAYNGNCSTEGPR